VKGAEELGKSKENSKGPSGREGLSLGNDYREKMTTVIKEEN